ncbi:hypothetical protein [Chryseobacterium sp. 2R14A]|uniref:hypothetical protein n=1 Tax=Chryseobacterium sp. 2R14A TaxID=3380353 RepID=UPI003CFAF5D0
MSKPINILNEWFKTGKKPTQEQFWELIDSFWHKDLLIPISSISNLNTTLDNKVDKNVYENNLSVLAHKDASNLSPNDIIDWKTALGVGQLPGNIATVDDGSNIGNVYTKNQSNDFFIAAADYTGPDGKILSSMIEALGLTELISVVETSLSAFIANNAVYQYQKNDFIAIPDGSGNYSLYIYNGGLKTSSTSYLPTGLTKITISMVEGLQTALNSKLDKPSQDGDFIVSKVAGETVYRGINPGSNYLLYYSSAKEFKPSSIYRDTNGNLGIGTTIPSEVLDVLGRIKSRAYVFSDNTENLPNQITKVTDRYYGSNASGIKRGLMYNDIADLTATMNGATDAQKDAWRVAGRKSNENYSLGQPRIDTVLPPAIDSTLNFIQYVTLVGLNLFINTSNPNSASVSIQRVKDINNNPVTDTAIAIDNVMVYQNNMSILSFGVNFTSYTEGYYKVIVEHNGLINVGLTTFLISASVEKQPIVLDNWEVFTPFNPTGLTVTPTLIKKTYDNAARGMQTLEHQVKHIIINKADVLTGFRLSFSYKLTVITSNDPQSVISRQLATMSLSYEQAVDGVIIPDIGVSIGNSLVLFGANSYDVFISGYQQPRIFEVDLIVKNGIVTYIVKDLAKGLTYTTTVPFEQKNEDMYFYFSSFGGGITAGNMNGVVQEVLLPTYYQKI